MFNLSTYDRPIDTTNDHRRHRNGVGVEQCRREQLLQRGQVRRLSAAAPAARYLQGSFSFRFGCRLFSFCVRFRFAGIFAWRAIDCILSAFSPIFVWIVSFIQCDRTSNVRGSFTSPPPSRRIRRRSRRPCAIASTRPTAVARQPAPSRFVVCLCVSV